MKILHYLTTFDFGLGGVTQYVYQALKAFSERNIEATLAVSRNVDIPPSWLENGTLPNVIELDSSPGFYGRLNKNAVEQIVNLAESHDVVHLHGAWCLGNVAIARRLKAKKIPYVISTHGMLDDWSMKQNGFLKKVYNITLNKGLFGGASSIHCTAEFEKEQVINNLKCPESQIYLTPYVVATDLPETNADVARDKFSIDENSFNVLFLSRLHHKKRPDLLLKSAAMHNNSNESQPIRLFMAGPGDEDYVSELKMLAAELGIQDSVVWTGMVREPLKTSLFLACDVFSLPTMQENFGIVFVEALLSGLPIITTKGTDIYRELEEAGAMIVPHEEEAISTELSKLKNDPELRKRLSDKGKQFVQKWLNHDKVIADHLSMYAIAERAFLGQQK